MTTVDTRAAALKMLSRLTAPDLLQVMSVVSDVMNQLHPVDEVVSNHMRLREHRAEAGPHWCPAERNLQGEDQP